MTVNGIQTKGCAKTLPASQGRKKQRVLVAAGLMFLGAVGLSACEFVYLPECDTQCQAGGGNDSYGGKTQ